MAGLEGSADVREITLPARRSRAHSTDYRAPRVRGDGRRSFLITLILFGTARRWVYYAGEAR